MHEIFTTSNKDAKPSFDEYSGLILNYPILAAGRFTKNDLCIFQTNANTVYNNDQWRQLRHNRPDLIYISVNKEDDTREDFYKRLWYVSKFEVVVPVFISSFKQAFPYCGCIWPFDCLISKKKADAGETNPRCINTYGKQESNEVAYDFNRVRALLGDKFKFKELCGTWPPDEIFQLTMFAKIYRIERKKLAFMKASSLADSVLDV